MSEEQDLKDLIFTLSTTVQNLIKDVSKVEKDLKELKEKFEKHGGHYYGGQAV